MRSSTPVHLRVSATEIAAQVRQLMLAPRDTHLGHRAPRDRRVHQTRRNIASGRTTPWEMVLEQSLTDLADGAPIASVLAPYQHIIAALVALDGEPTPQLMQHPLTLVQRETRAQAALDEAQLAAVANPNDRAALRRCLAAATSYEDALGRLNAALREREVRLELVPDSLPPLSLPPAA